MPPPKKRRSSSRRGTAEGRKLGQADAARFVADRRSIEQFLNSESGDIAKALARSMVRIERGAKRRCPVDTGRLRSSITWGVDVDGQGLYGQVGTNVEYATYVEFGSDGAEEGAITEADSLAFLRPALEDERRRLA